MIQKYEDIQVFLEQYIPKTHNKKFSGEKGIQRSEYFYSLLDNPQDKIKTIHVAGTSGKGSTSALISNLLQSHEFYVGLTLSPHIITLRERVQIQNIPISKEAFLNNFLELLPAIKLVEESSFGKLSNFEILLGLAFYTFAKEKVDYAVIETGIGGLYDSTNTIHSKDKISVITKIGFDHMNVLGNTITKIAKQKAGIIHEGQDVITTKQNQNARKVIEQKVKDMNSRLFTASIPTHVSISEIGTKFDFQYESINLNNLTTNLVGIYQADNACLALTTLYTIAQRDNWNISEKNIRDGLNRINLPGRFDIIHKGIKTIVIDGAHNTQKMKYFIKSLILLYPNQRFPVLINIRNIKQSRSVLKYILPITSILIITQYHLKQNSSEQSDNVLYLETIAKRLGFSTIIIENDLVESMKIAMNNGNICITTGSLYFASDIYTKIPIFTKNISTIDID